MRAIRIHSYGGPEVLRYETDVPDPTLGDGDVLVRVRAAGINPVDWKVRRGYLAQNGYALPLILGWDVSGVVERAGGGFQAGDEVYARPDIKRSGCYAELVAVRATEIAKKPSSLAHVHAASVPLAALTAWQMLFEPAQGFTGLDVKAGQTVLIHAASGGVGSFAVQFAKNKGAKVIGTCSTKNVDYVKSLGADDVIDYTKHDFAQVVKNVDAVFDTVGGDVQTKSFDVVREGGVVGSIVGKPTAPAGKRAAYVFVQPNAQQLGAIAKLIDDDKVRVHVSEILPLKDAKKAHELSETGHVRGKIVLEV